MDADLSHDPDYLPTLVAATATPISSSDRATFTASAS